VDFSECSLTQVFLTDVVVRCIRKKVNNKNRRQTNMPVSKESRHIFLKSLLHNIGAGIVSLAVALLGILLGLLLSIPGFFSLYALVAGLPLFIIGFLLRMWATIYFYRNGLKVISTEPQGKLITYGPFRFSRNPLYLGGNVFMFFGAALMLGSTMGLLITVIHLPFLDFFIRREEKQLEQKYGEEWRSYKKRVRRWL
jgi:protein-S-isoprenylcysteine O-methyltransferase Ste14